MRGLVLPLSVSLSFSVYLSVASVCVRRAGLLTCQILVTRLREAIEAWIKAFDIPDTDNEKRVLARMSMQHSKSKSDEPVQTDSKVGWSVVVFFFV